MTVKLNHTIVHAHDKRASADFYAGEAGFDRIFGRVQARGLDWWADPALEEKGKINRHDGGRGVYFKDPAGNILEIITRPYGATDG